METLQRVLRRSIDYAVAVTIDEDIGKDIVICAMCYDTGCAVKLARFSRENIKASRREQLAEDYEARASYPPWRFNTRKHVPTYINTYAREACNRLSRLAGRRFLPR